MLKERLRSWWQKIRNHWIIALIVAILTLFALIIFAGYWFNWAWTGLNPSIGPNVQQYQPGKTLWDWLQLFGVLAIPAVVGLGAAWYTAQQGKVADRENTDNQRETALQQYIDKMSELLLEKHLRESQPEDEVRTIARVRTITILFQLDARRIGYVFAFLREAGLMSAKSNSSIVNLSLANLTKINLSLAKLNEADLREANLEEADLHGANLSKANLSRAVLYRADLHGADLYEADLSKVDLRGANLSGVHLKGANLSGANLKDATGITTEELEKKAKSLKGATMPDGSIHP